MGGDTKSRINCVITDIYEQSYLKEHVRLSQDVWAAIVQLREFMFEKVYSVTNKSMQDRAERMLSAMYAYFMKNTDELPESYLRLRDSSSKEQIVCDYLSGMTDRYAIGVFESLFIPETFTLGGVTV